MEQPTSTILVIRRLNNNKFNHSPFHQLIIIKLVQFKVEGLMICLDHISESVKMDLMLKMINKEGSQISNNWIYSHNNKSSMAKTRLRPRYCQKNFSIRQKVLKMPESLQKVSNFYSLFTNLNILGIMQKSAKAAAAQGLDTGK